jgi:hypothetical protein
LSEHTKNPNILYISLTLSPSGGKIDKVNSAKVLTREANVQKGQQRISHLVEGKCPGAKDTALRACVNPHRLTGVIGSRGRKGIISPNTGGTTQIQRPAIFSQDFFVICTFLPKDPGTSTSI